MNENTPPASPSGGVSLGLLAALAASAYVAGRFTKSGSESPLPSLSTLVMTYVVFKGLDIVWPVALTTVQATTLPGTLSGMRQMFSAPRVNFTPPSKQTVDSFTVK